VAERIWQVLIADLKSSREIAARERTEVDRALRRAVGQVARHFAGRFRLDPEVLRGDEVQAVLRRDAPALTILTYLRARLASAAGRRIELRAGIGRGSVQRLSARGPFASEGQAFHRARAALDRARQAGGTRRTSWATGETRFDDVANAILGLTDAFVTRWTIPQWEAIAGRIEGKGLDAIARAERVAFQSVSKRLRAASWNEIEQAMDLLQLQSLSIVGDGQPAPREGARGSTHELELSVSKS
jgi:hypothetical protein